MRFFIASKIHGIRVTDKSTRYHGSVAIDSDLLRAAGIAIYERVEVVNLNNGARWTTYVIPAAPGHFSLNGGGARLGEINDECVVMTYKSESSFSGATVIFCDEENRVSDRMRYEST